MRILGIDPGTNLCGYGLLEEKEGRVTALKWGVVDARKEKTHHEKLFKVSAFISEIILADNPDILAIEKAFISKNVQSAFKLGHIRGAIIVAALNHGLEVAEFSPTEVKQSVVGHGRAEKEQVNMMVQRLCHIREEVRSLDASDALAVAFCCVAGNPLRSRISGHL